MRFSTPLIEGTLIRRDKRFVADVRLENGDEVAVHCGHPGSMMGINEPGSKVLLSTHNDPRRKFQHQLEIVYAGRTPVAIHAGRPSSIVAEAIIQGRIEKLAGYASLKQNTRHDKETRIDLLLSGNSLRACHINVKAATLAHENVAYYPDVTADNDIDELSTLTNIVREGNRAMLIYVAQRSDVEWFRPSDHIDAEFGEALRDATARGVELLAFRAKVTRRGIELEAELPIDLGG